LIKNNKKIIYNISCDFIDSDDYIELTNLFNNAINYTFKYKIYEYIEEIEKMIRKLNGFQKCVLK
jgi:hypothetical protein